MSTKSAKDVAIGLRRKQIVEGLQQFDHPLFQRILSGEMDEDAALSEYNRKAKEKNQKVIKKARVQVIAFLIGSPIVFGLVGFVVGGAIQNGENLFSGVVVISSILGAFGGLLIGAMVYDRMRKLEKFIEKDECEVSKGHKLFLWYFTE